MRHDNGSPAPGLCEADRIKAPKGTKPPSRVRTTALAAGVLSRESLGDAERCIKQVTFDMKLQIYFCFPFKNKSKNK